MDVTKYLKRIGYTGAIDPTLETLVALHRAHLRSAPFENLDIHIGNSIILEEARLFAKIVDRRRGGFCYELNGNFAWLLRSLGFDVDLLSAAVARPDGQYDPPYDHLALRVNLERPLLADVGFGDSFLEPIPLEDGVITTQAEVDYRVVRSDDFRKMFNDEPTYLLERRPQGKSWDPEYVFSLRPCLLSEFEEMCTYHQTSPASMFTQKRICSLATEDGRLTLTGLKLIETRGNIRLERGLSGAADFRETLSTRFGIDLAPEDVQRLVESGASSNSHG